MIEATPATVAIIIRGICIIALYAIFLAGTSFDNCVMIDHSSVIVAMRGQFAASHNPFFFQVGTGNLITFSIPVMSMFAGSETGDDDGRQQGKNQGESSGFLHFFILRCFFSISSAEDCVDPVLAVNTKLRESVY